MIKQRLINKRRERNLTQEEIAFVLGMETSSYNRRENGITKISKKEWDKIAKQLKVHLEDIYEPDDGIYVINYENSSTSNFNTKTNLSIQDDFILETLKKYILKLEEEIKELKSQLQIRKN